MDPIDNQCLVPGLSEDEKIKLGAQQAALLHLQEAETLKRQQALLDEEHRRQMLLAQQALVDKEQQQQQQIAMLQALKQREAEQLALLERKAEEHQLLQQPASTPVPLMGLMSAVTQPHMPFMPPVPVPPMPTGLATTPDTTGMFATSGMPTINAFTPQATGGISVSPVPLQTAVPQAPKSLMSLQVRPPGTAPIPNFPPGTQRVQGPLGSLASTSVPVAMPAAAQEQTNESDQQSSTTQDTATSSSATQQTSAAAQAPKEVKLPVALEKVLAFKDARVTQVGMKPEDLERVEEGEVITEGELYYDTHEKEEHEHEEEHEIEPVEDKKAQKESKNKKKKQKKKKKAKSKQHQEESDVRENGKDESAAETDDNVEVEYVPEQITFSRYDATYYEFMRIFDAFKITQPDKSKDLDTKLDGTGIKIDEKRLQEIPIKARGLIDIDEEEKPPEVDKSKLSKKKLKKMNRLSVAELKQLVTRPDVVEMHDVTSRDPKLLVHLKGTRNTVTVPRHWCFKRKYLQGKRGIEKPPFDLPDFIKATGIMEMRQALQEKEDQKTLKAKMRERVRPKMGKIDIDYQKLHDAFFKWQTKPKMTIHGDLYYEGKEFETRLKEKKPGNLSDDLRVALGMPIGSNSEKYPPPWLIAMQRYGPPPSYPTLKIPGLTAPIPEGCAFGYHAGGWGKPPVDESGKPLYGDVFGPAVHESQVPAIDEEVDKSLWGELESESSEEESEEEEEEDRELESGLVTPGETGLVTPSGVTSVPIGVETPDMIELRKRRIEDAMDQGGDTPALPYTILPEKKSAVAGAMMGSTHVYDIAATMGKKVSDRVTAEGIEVALNPEELDLDTAAMQAKYEQTVREQQSQLEKEDLSDMVAEHAAKQQKKRKKQQQQQESSGKAAKKYKDFKF